MASHTQSYSRSLRVIGQALDVLGISTFTLEKKDDKYVVGDWESSFLKSVVEEVWGTGDFAHRSLPAKRSGNRLIYSPSDTERLENQGRSRRGAKDKPDSHMIASGLRSVGNYLDKERAVAFDIWWSAESVRVRFAAATGGPKETSFTMDNLQNLTLSMYQRRSNR